MIRLTLASNALHLEAARRLRCRPELRAIAGGASLLELLLWEPGRMRLTALDRRLWPVRLPVAPLSLALLVPLAMLGVVRELRLAHLRNAGRALRRIAERAGRLVLLDDGLDQYRQQPRAVDPERFAADTPCWLFSDAPEARAAWCRRFRCHELGPLYQRPAPLPEAAPGATGSLILDAPGLERLAERAASLPQPWRLAAHPVVAKRSWSAAGPTLDAGRLGSPPEALIPRFPGWIVVGESMTLLAAARLHRPEARVVISLPETVDAGLQQLAARLAARDPALTLLPPGE
ncbi:MAG: hypothetical protein VKJ05_09600 [Synechococcaceae cyanobacterium]|nr:hypothetical protein [Synechococcaceae cyanobacterium]